MIMLVAIGVSSAADGCSKPYTSRDLELSARQVQDRLIQDNGAVLRARPADNELLASIPCVAEPLTPSAAAEVLLAHGLTTFFTGELESAGSWFLAARSAAPELSLNPELAPHERHPLAVQWAQARGGRDNVTLPTLDQGMWFVNGRPTATAPVGHPYLLQQVAQNGTILQTALVTVGPPPTAMPPATASASPEPIAAVRPLPEVPEPAPEPVPESVPKVVTLPPSEPVPESSSKPGFPTRTVVGGVLLVGGTALASSVALRRDTLCTLPDANGDGFFDCPTGTTAAFWAGVGGASVGALLGAVGLGTEFRRADVNVGATPGGGWQGELRVSVR
ncbi:MAG: hypothetical protein AAGA48_14470 [Myxococcota bacterium]